MKKNTAKITQNFLEKKPVIKQGLKWTADSNGAITLELENKGFVNKLAQKLIKKPQISYIHLDETGNFVWSLIDGQTNLIEIGKSVKDHFGDKAEPLYERLSQYFKTLETYGFIDFV